MGHSAGLLDALPPEGQPLVDDLERIVRKFIGEHPEIMSEKVRNTLRANSKLWQAAQNDVNGVSDLVTRLEQRRSSMARKLNAGESISAESLSPLAVVDAEREELKQLGLERQRQLGEETFRIAAEVFPRLLSAFDQWVIEKIRSESDLYAKCGITFVVDRSHLTRSLRAAVNRLRRTFEAASARRNAVPKDLFSFLDLA